MINELFDKQNCIAVDMKIGSKYMSCISEKIREFIAIRKLNYSMRALMKCEHLQRFCRENSLHQKYRKKTTHHTFVPQTYYNAKVFRPRRR